MFEVTIEETFAAGHALRNYKGKCENVHGHNYRCQVTMAGQELDHIGLLVDFVELKRVVHSVLDRMDHARVQRCPEQHGRVPHPQDDRVGHPGKGEPADHSPRPCPPPGARPPG